MDDLTALNGAGRTRRVLVELSALRALVGAHHAESKEMLMDLSAAIGNLRSAVDAQLWWVACHQPGVLAPGVVP